MAHVSTLISEILPELIALRHDLHSHPELGYQEHETARRVLERLERLPGISIRRNVAETGIIATLGAEKPGPCIALRADMDCLPIQEQTGRPYASKHPGRMHACGHDGHTTCLVGAATALARLSDALHGPVKFIFQPAEEGGAGGRRMCEAGALDDPRADAIFALHGWPLMELGTAGCRIGPSLASTNPFEIIVHGVGAHAAYPHKGIDPILIASHIVVALQSVVSRNTDPNDACVVTVGAIEAGTAENIIPPSARMRGTIRTLNPQLRGRAVQRVREIAQRIADAFDGRADVNIREGYPVTVNEPTATEFFLQTARETLGDDAVDPNVPPSLGGEDFAFYGERIPAAFWRLGVRPRGVENFPNLHQPTFDFPDDAIPIGVRLHCELALRFAREWAVQILPASR